MTREEVLRWVEDKLGVRATALEGGSAHRLEWIAVACTLGDWTLNDIEQAIEQTKNVKPMSLRIDEILRILQRAKFAKFVKAQQS